LDGDLAERKGAMVGGFRLKRKHSMGFKEQDIVKEIGKYEMEISELKSTIDVIEKNKVTN